MKANWTIVEGGQGFVMIGYTERQYCVTNLPDFGAEGFQSGEEISCVAVPFSPLKDTEKIMRIQTSPNGKKIYLATDLRIYKLDPLKGFKVALFTQRIGSEPLKYVHFVKNESCIFIDNEDDLYMAEIKEYNHIDNRAEFKENGEKRQIVSQKLKKESLDSPTLIRTSGEFVIIKETDPYTRSNIYTIYNSSSVKIPKIREINPIFEKKSYSNGITLNNTLILFGKKGDYLVYKTDLNGFIRSENLHEENLVGFGYFKDKQHMIIKYFLDSNKRTLQRKIEFLSSISLTCAPHSEYITFLNHNMWAAFMTYIEDCKDGVCKSPPRKLGHKIIWLNKVNSYGVFSWFLSGVFGLVLLCQIIKGFFKYNRDNRLMDKVNIQDKKKQGASRSSSFRRRVTDFFSRLSRDRNFSRDTDQVDMYDSFNNSYVEEGRVESKSWGLNGHPGSRESTESISCDDSNSTLSGI